MALERKYELYTQEFRQNACQVFARMRRDDPVLIIPILGAANRHEAEFPRSDQLDIHHEHNPHMVFGRGAHYCLGAPLARLEAEIALNTWLRRLPDLRLAVPAESLEYRLVPLFHARTAVPIAWDFCVCFCYNQPIPNQGTPFLCN